MLFPNFRLAGVIGICLFVSGCSATTTAVSKRNLDVQTKMSDSIFLDPLPPHQRTVFIQIRNTSDKTNFSIENEINAAVIQRGYRLVDNPDKASYLLQANVLQVGKTSPTAAEQAFGSGFGGALFGGAIGAVGTRAGTKNTGAIIGGGLAGAAAEAITGSFVQDVTYTAITDIQISERVTDGSIITETLEQNIEEGSSGSRIIRASTTSSWKRYRTRVVSTANRVNLDFDEAAPQLADGLTRSIAGVF